MLKRTIKLTSKTKLKNNTQLKRSSEAIRGGKKGLKSGKRLSSKPRTKQQKEAARNRQKMDREFYSTIRDQRGNKSEISGTVLQSELSSANYHHIISKSSWKEGRYIPENVIIMTLQEHSQVEQNIHVYIEVNRRRELLKIKYDI